MKSKIILFFTVLAFFSGAQTNLVIFSEDSEPFYAYINGVKQNARAETNVKVTNVNPNISLRIEFEDNTIPSLKQTMSLEQGYEHTARLKRDKNKQMKLRYFGRVPIAEATADVPAVEYHTAETTEADGTAVNNNTTTNSTITTSESTQSMNVNMTMPGVVIQMSPSAPVRSTTSTTVTQTTSSTGTAQQHEKPQPVYSSTGCRQAMSQASFAKLKQTVESKPFSDTKMSTAKVATKNNCLSINQVKEICKLFKMDDDKLTYAKFAYDYCIDKSNYYQVSEVFSFSSSADELNKFLDK